MIYLHTTFQTPSCNSSLITAMQWKAKYGFLEASMLFYSLKNYNLYNSCIFSRTCYSNPLATAGVMFLRSIAVSETTVRRTTSYGELGVGRTLIRVEVHTKFQFRSMIGTDCLGDLSIDRRINIKTNIAGIESEDMD